MILRSSPENNVCPEASDGSEVLGAGIGTVFYDSLINRQMRNSDLTTFMLKKRDFILRLC